MGARSRKDLRSWNICDWESFFGGLYRQVRICTATSPEFRGLAANAGENEASEILRADQNLLESLSSKQQQIYRKSEIEGKCAATIAMELRITKVNVQRQLSRIRQKIAAQNFSQKEEQGHG